MTFIDPPEAPEGGGMRAADLKNRVLLLLPKEHATAEGKDGKPWEYVSCDVWVLDRAGVTEQGNDVRFSWWKAVAQLKESIGNYVGAKPVEQDDRSVVLMALTGEAREVAAKTLASLNGAATSSPPVSEPPSGEEPF